MTRVSKRADRALAAIPSASLWPDFAVCLMLTLATIAAYYRVSQFEFVNYDDPAYVSQNAHIRGGLSGEGVAWALTSGEYGNWFPVTRLSYLIDRQFFGGDPGGEHVVNLLFHILSALLLFGLLRSLTGALWRSAFVAALFALHPLHVESVAWITERKDVLSAVFWFAAAWAYVRYARRPSKQRYAILLAAFCLGLMAKPVVVTLPLMLLLLDFWPLRRMELGVKPKTLVLYEKLPLLALSAASGVVTYLVQAKAGAVSPWDSLPMGQRLANAADAYATYIFQMFWPARLAVFYPMTVPAWWRVCGSALLLFAVTLLAVRWVRRRPWFAAGWFWYLIALLPMSGLVQVGAAAHADRYTYLPLVGLSIILAWAAAELAAARPRVKAAVTVIAAAGCAACLVLTSLQTQYWQNSVALFRHAIEVTSGNWVAYNDLGVALRNQGLTDEAIADFREALIFRANFVDALVNLGEAYNSQGRFEEGARYCREALAINPRSPEAHGDLGSALGALGKTAEAEPEFRAALRLRPDDPKAYNNLGIALATEGRLTEAIDDFRDAVRLDQDYANAEFNLGAAFANSGRLDEAVTHLSAALRLRPGDERSRQILEAVSARLREARGH